MCWFITAHRPSTPNRIGVNWGFYAADLGAAAAASRLEPSPIPSLWAGEAPLPALPGWTLASRPVRHRDFCDCRQKYATFAISIFRRNTRKLVLIVHSGDAQLGGNKRRRGGNRAAAVRLRSQLCPSTWLCSIFKSK